MPSKPREPLMLARSRELRKNMTCEERKLWFRYLHEHPMRFRRQAVIGRYIVDFYCPAAGLAIELDGRSTLSQMRLPMTLPELLSWKSKAYPFFDSPI